MQLKARVYYITKNEDLYNIHAYIEYGRKKEFLTFQTKKEIPEIILKKYENIEEESKYYYPKVFITPTPSIRKIKQPIRLDDKFNLVLVYAKNIPPYIPSDKLIKVSKIGIYEKNGKLQKMYVKGTCGLYVLNNSNNNSKLKSYTINLRRANLDDLLQFIRYDYENNQSNGNRKMKNVEFYIFIGEDRNLSCKQSYITPRDIKILGMYRLYKQKYNFNAAEGI
jgi:hypothetical protein